jgi:hypothetical protein
VTGPNNTRSQTDSGLALSDERIRGESYPGGRIVLCGRAGSAISVSRGFMQAKRILSATTRGSRDRGIFLARPAVCAPQPVTTTTSSARRGFSRFTCGVIELGPTFAYELVVRQLAVPRLVG